MSFSGTENRRDWANNAKVLPSKFSDPFLHNQTTIKGVWVHTGFGVQFESIREVLYEVLGDLIGEKQGATVVATGHSLGGALATLLTFDLKYG